MMSKQKYFKHVLNKKKTQYSKRRKSYSKAWAGGFSIWATVVNFSITNWSRVTDKCLGDKW